MLLASAHGSDMTPAVQSGLAWFYLLAFLLNIGFGWYQQRYTRQTRWAFVWYGVAVLFLGHALWYGLGSGPTLPLWFRELFDRGIRYSLLAMGLPPGGPSAWTINDWITGAIGLATLLATLAGIADLIMTTVGGEATRPYMEKILRPIFGSLSTAKRLEVWLLIVTVLSFLYAGLNAITFSVVCVALFIGFLLWRKTLTQPNIAWLVLNLGLLYGGWSMTDKDFRALISKPDNVPIVGMVFVLGFFTWLAFRKAVINDERMAKGEPPVEKEGDEKVLVWPDLVYTELICMILVTTVLIIWAVWLPAPLEQPASGTKTPNPSKAPWYFLGLQEMLVYFDPWIAGVLMPTFIILGLMALPYIDFNQKGSGYYTFAQRPFAIVNFLVGFLLLWSTMIFLMTMMRGPNQNFYGLYEYWDPHKLVPANNVNLSDYFWVRGIGKVWDHPSGGVSVWIILIRELPGILLLLGYFMILPPLLARTVFRPFFLRMGFARYMVMVTLLLLMASLPIKMVLRWTINLKYIVAIPEWFFNI